MTEEPKDAATVDLDALRFATWPAIEYLQAIDDDLGTNHAGDVLTALAAFSSEVRLLRAKLDAARAMHKLQTDGPLSLVSWPYCSCGAMDWRDGSLGPAEYPCATARALGVSS